MWHGVSVCVAEMCDWQMLIEALLEMDNERITVQIFLRESMYEDKKLLCNLGDEKRVRKAERG